MTATAGVQAHPDTVKQSAPLIIMVQEHWSIIGFIVSVEAMLTNISTTVDTRKNNFIFK